MTRGIYSKLAKDNIFKNKKIYFPFIISVILSTFMLYIIHSLSLNPDLNKVMGGKDLQSILSFGVIVICFFILIFLFYTNSFIVKRRTKEFGLYGILGMEKRHVSKVIFLENAFILAFSLIIGLGLSIVFDKLFFLLATKMMATKAPLGFYISLKSLAFTAGFISLIFLLIFLNSLRYIHTSKPVELLNSGKVGEKEPKAQYFMTLVGLVMLGAGYYISITTKNPIAALMLFFVAVILVIAATYILFTTGSVSLLKTLKNNKNYYYRPEKFISTSSMIYRMKQNAVGLANIAILSTMVLVALSTSVAMWVGVNDLLDTRYPRENVFAIYESDEKEEIIEIINRRINKDKLPTIDKLEYESLTFPVKFTEEKVMLPDDLGMLNNPLSDFSVLNILTLDDYNIICGTSEKLANNEVLIYSSKSAFDYKKLNIANRNLDVRVIEETKLPDLLANTVFDTKTMIVKDRELLDELATQVEEYSGFGNTDKTHYIMFNTNLSKEENIKIVKEFQSDLSNYKGYTYESKSSNSESFKSLYAGLFFVGIFVSGLFLLATIIIVYYKQISEGLEDKGRFEIMQKVGLDKDMVKKSINSQILIVFFLPLIVAVIHLIFAYPIIKRLLAMLMLTNIKLYIISALAVVGIFGLIYYFIYKVTSKVYYDTVKY